VSKVCQKVKSKKESNVVILLDKKKSGRIRLNSQKVKLLESLLESET